MHALRNKNSKLCARFSAEKWGLAQKASCSRGNRRLLELLFMLVYGLFNTSYQLTRRSRQHSDRGYASTNITRSPSTPNFIPAEKNEDKDPKIQKLFEAPLALPAKGLPPLYGKSMEDGFQRKWPGHSQRVTVEYSQCIGCQWSDRTLWISWFGSASHFQVHFGQLTVKNYERRSTSTLFAWVSFSSECPEIVCFPVTKTGRGAWFSFRNKYAALDIEPGLVGWMQNH